MNKGVGIGCAAAVLLALAAVVGGAWWLHHKIVGVGNAVEELKAQQKTLASLDDRFAFTVPPGQLPVISEQKLRAYLEIREATLAAYEQLEKKVQDFRAEHAKDGEAVNARTTLEVTQTLESNFAQVRATYVKQLEDHKMSPKEFAALTGAIYSPPPANDNAQKRELLQQQILDTGKAIPGKPPDVAAVLKQQLTILKTQLGEIPDERDDLVAAANATTVGKYQDRVSKLANSGLDAFAMDAGGKRLVQQLTAGAGPTAR